MQCQSENSSSIVYTILSHRTQNGVAFKVNGASVWQPEDPESFTVAGFRPPQIQSIVHNFTHGNKE